MSYAESIMHAMIPLLIPLLCVNILFLRVRNKKQRLQPWTLRRDLD